MIENRNFVMKCTSIKVQLYIQLIINYVIDINSLRAVQCQTSFLVKKLELSVSILRELVSLLYCKIIDMSLHSNNFFQIF